MEKIAMKPQRNQTLECCRMIGAVFVVFLHVPFPGEFGGFTACLSRFAVPMFFAISGWYSYRADSKKLLQRYFRILLLEVMAVALHILWGTFHKLYFGVPFVDCMRSFVPDRMHLLNWLVRQMNPYAGHLWYLPAAEVSYLVAALYMRVWGSRKGSYWPMYLLSAGLLLCHFCMAEGAALLDTYVEFTYYRNAWFFGIPMFTMGLGLRQLREGLSEKGKSNAAVPAAVLIFGVLLSLAEWDYFGGFDLYVGTVIAVAGLMLLTAARPQVPRWLEGPAKHFGFLSTGVYLIHLIIHEAYGYFFSWKLEAVLGAATPWLVPLLVAGVSIALSLAADLAVRVWRRFV